MKDHADIQYGIEWKEHGRWNRSTVMTPTPEEAREHGRLVGARQIRLVTYVTIVAAKVERPPRRRKGRSGKA
jgi:hypothetical protein